MPRAMVIVAGADVPRDGEMHPPSGGLWASDVSQALAHFEAAGWQITIATVRKGAPQLDPISLDPRFHFEDSDRAFAVAIARSFGRNPEDVVLSLDQRSALMPARRFYRHLLGKDVCTDRARQRIECAARTAWRTQRSLADVLKAESQGDASIEPSVIDELEKQTLDVASDRAASVEASVRDSRQVRENVALMDLGDDAGSEADVYVFCGGRGAQKQWPENDAIGRLITRAHRRRRVLCFLSQGASALLSTGRGIHGAWLFDGIRLTGASDDESAQLRALSPIDPEWRLETDLKNRGAVYQESAPWSPHVVVDRNVITAQNFLSTPAALASVVSDVRSAA